MTHADDDLLCLSRSSLRGLFARASLVVYIGDGYSVTMVCHVRLMLSSPYTPTADDDD